jgi:hypothetical protein
VIVVPGQVRSIEEIQFYPRLHPCPDCGDNDISQMVFSIADVDDVDGMDYKTFSFYEGPCAGCGIQRGYAFGEPATLTRTPDLELGGPEPAQILTPLLLREAAERYLTRVPWDPTGLDEAASGDAWRAVRWANTALHELAKFPGAAGYVSETRVMEAQRLYDRYWRHLTGNRATQDR